MPDFLKTLRRGKTLGAALVILALTAALCCVRLPQPPSPLMRGAASHRSAAPEQTPAKSGAVAVNTAGEEELTAVKGIGPALAAEILREREANGPFYYPEDLLMVKGIGEKKLADLSVAFDFSTEGVSP